MKHGLAIALFLLAGCVSQPSDPSVLATVEDAAIDLEAYTNAYVEYLASTGLPDEPQRRQSFLNRLIGVELVVQEARDDGIGQSTEFQEYQLRARQKAMIEAYLHEEVYDSLEVGESDEQSMFRRVNTQLTARHLFAATREEAERLHARLLAGESFEALAQEVFADPRLANSGGLIGDFGFDEMDPAFEDAAYELDIGAVSAPVKTAQGYSIIRVDNRFEKPVLTEQEYFEKRPALRQYVLDRKQDAARRSVLQDIAVGASVQVDEDAASILLDRITGAGLPDQAIEEEMLSRPFVTFLRDGEEVSWTGQQFREAAGSTSERQRAQVSSREDLQAFVEGLVVRDVILDRASQFAADRRVERAVAAAESEWIYKRAYAQLTDRVEVSEDSIAAHFARFAYEYTQPERREVREIVTRTRRAADSIRAVLSPGNFESFARQNSIRAESAQLGGSIGWLSREELGDWADDVFAADTGEVVGPLEIRGQYLLLEAGAMQPSRPSTIDEARPLIESELRRFQTRSYLRDHVAELRSRYSVRVYVDSFAALPLRRNAHASS